MKAEDSEIARIGTGRALRRSTLAFLPLPVLGAPIESWVEGDGLWVGLRFSAGVLVFVWVLIFRPKVIVTESKLKIVNPLWSRTVDRKDISSVTACYMGLEIRRFSGRPVTALAVFRSNWSTARKTNSRGVIVQDALALWVQGDSGRLRELPRSAR